MPTNSEKADPNHVSEQMLLVHTAATMYYIEEETQSAISERLGVSRPTVSRLLSEARRTGIVHIEVPPLRQVNEGNLAAEIEDLLGLRKVRLIPPSTKNTLGQAFAPALSESLSNLSLRPGSVVVVATGRAIYETIQTELIPLPGVIVVPALGGLNEPEPWYQANEISRKFAEKVSGYPSQLYAPALPGVELHETLLKDDAIVHVINMWTRAECAVLGIGAPPRLRKSISAAIPANSEDLRSSAIGDVCLRFFDIDGITVPFSGSERLLAISKSELAKIPLRIALASGQEKAVSIIGAARGGYFNELITDLETARAVRSFFTES